MGERFDLQSMLIEIQEDEAIAYNAEDSDQSLLDAQSGMERVKYELYQTFLASSAW